MNTQHATPAAKTKNQTTLARALEQETTELETLHTGLVRHLNAWRGAHDATIARLDTVMTRIDGVIERLEARQKRS